MRCASSSNWDGNTINDDGIFVTIHPFDLSLLFPVHRYTHKADITAINGTRTCEFRLGGQKTDAVAMSGTADKNYHCFNCNTFFSMESVLQNGNYTVYYHEKGECSNQVVVSIAYTCSSNGKYQSRTFFDGEASQIASIINACWNKICL